MFFRTSKIEVEIFLNSDSIASVYCLFMEIIVCKKDRTIVERNPNMEDFEFFAVNSTDFTKNVTPK